MPELYQVLIASPVISLIPTYLALRLRDWRFGVLAALIPLPLAVLYVGLLILPALQLAGAVALRWRVGPTGWLILLTVGTGVWLVGIVAPFWGHWSVAWAWIYLAGFGAGLVALIWQHTPWTATRN